MTGLAARREAEGQSRLLRDHDGAERPAPVAFLDGPEFRQRVLRPREPGAPLVGDPLRAEAATRLLVGGGEEDEIALEGHAGAGDGQERGELHDARGLHVEGAPAVDVAVAEEAAEGIYRPVALVRVYDVNMMMEDDTTQGAVAAETRHEVAAPRSRLRRLAGDPRAVQDLGEKACPRRLVAGRVRGVHPQVLSQETHRLVADLLPVHHALASVQWRPGFGRLARRRSSSGRA